MLIAAGPVAFREAVKNVFADFVIVIVLKKA